MNFGYLRNHATVQGDVKLTMWSKDGSVLYEDEVHGTEDIDTCGLHLWDYQEIKYIFAAPDGFLHIDFEREDD